MTVLPPTRKASGEIRTAQRSGHVLSRAGGAPRPFFEASGGSPTARRLLLISPLFVPDQGVGVLRWQRMSRYLVERGWELDVITLHPDCIESPDWSRLTDLPRGIRLFGVHTPILLIAQLIDKLRELLRSIRPRVPVHQCRTHDSSNVVHMGSIAGREFRWDLAKPRGYIRMYNVLLIRAELRRWARDAFGPARQLVAPGLHDAVISSGPPNSAHEAARLVSRHTGLPFVMDMRDTWSVVQRAPERIASPLLLHLAARHERQAVNQASLVVTNTHGARSAMAKIYPEATERILTVMNGYDDEPLPPTKHGSQFIVAYAGTIYLDRDPRFVFRAAGQVIEELRLSPTQFALKFIGANDWGIPLTEMAEAEGVIDFLSVGPPRARAEALEFLAQANMLLILPQDTDLAIPAKIFEYMRYEAWLLALAEPGSAVALVLQDSAADVVSSRDIRGIASTIRMRYQQFAAGVRPRPIASDVRLSRRYQTQLLLDAIERCVRPSLNTDTLVSGRPSTPGSSSAHLGSSAATST